MNVFVSRGDELLSSTVDVSRDYSLAAETLDARSFEWLCRLGLKY